MWVGVFLNTRIDLKLKKKKEKLRLPTDFTVLQEIYAQHPLLLLYFRAHSSLNLTTEQLLEDRMSCVFGLQFFLCFFFPQPFPAVCLNVLFHSSNITVPFPLYYLIPLILLSVLDVGEATAPALPPTSLHDSLHTFILLLDVRHPHPPFHVPVRNMLQSAGGYVYVIMLMF